MKRFWFRLSLARLAAIAWVAWLVTLAVTVWLSLSGVLHPNFLYMVIPLAVQLLATVLLVLGGLWRLVRGPGRFRAIVWLLLGMLPTLWTAACIEFGVRTASGRSAGATAILLDKYAGAFSSVVIEPYVRVRYPHRYEGRRFVMWSDSPEANDAAMKAMDDHILAMEKELGGRSKYKVYWVRGDVWGIGGRCGSGWALGTPAFAAPDGADGLHSIDRHEVAHFVLDELMPPDNDVPRLLHEGWAQYHMGSGARRDWRVCWQDRRTGRLRSLRELTGPEWYHTSQGAVYQQGHVLVDYLLRRFGPAKFLEFCRTCRQATFDADLRHVFVLSLDELDRAYQDDLAQYDSPDQHFLLSLALADGVDPSRWRRFVDDYCAGTMRLRTAFRHSSVKMLRTRQWPSNDTLPRVDVSWEFHRDDRRKARIRTDKSSGEVSVQITTPQAQFMASKDGDKPWRLDQYCTRPPATDYETAVALGNDGQEYLDWPLDPLQWQDDWVSPMITIVGYDDSDGQPIRVSFEAAFTSDGKPSVTRGWWDLDPALDYGLVAARSDYFDAQEKLARSSHITVEYETIDGHHFPKVACQELSTPEGRVNHRRTDKIESCRFASPPPEVFELSSYGNLSPQVATKPEPVTLANNPPPTAGPLTWIAGASSLVVLLLGSILAVSSCRQRRRKASSDGPTSH